VGMGNGEEVKGFPHGSSGRGGLVTPASPYSVSADSDKPRQRRSSSGQAKGRPTSLAAAAGGGKEVAESIALRTLRLDDRIPLHYRMILALVIPRHRHAQALLEGR
jgi:hypothetical protein